MTSPLTLLAKNELQTAVLLLHHAATSLQWVSALFARAGDRQRASFLDATRNQVLDEMKAIRAMVEQARDGGHA